LVAARQGMRPASLGTSMLGESLVALVKRLRRRCPKTVTANRYTGLAHEDLNPLS
jgi:hypothetical protein